MKRLTAIIIIVLVLNSVILSQQVYFTDGNLKLAVEAWLGVSNPSANNMRNLTYLSVVNYDIYNLTGLEYATNLKELYLSKNQISSLSPLSGLTNLKILDLYSNQIDDISPLSELTNLQNLCLYENQINNVSPLAELTNLNYLYLSHNRISDISSLVGLTQLFYLDLQNNPLNQQAYDIYIPQIESNGTYVSYNEYVSAAVPNVVGIAGDEAESVITFAGLYVQYTYQHSDTIEAGLVISQNPTGGTSVPVGSEVELVISLGQQQPDEGPPAPPDADYLLAYWKLDEARGNIAYDSSGIGNDGVLSGNPQWQPNAGQIDGALLFDGDNDYVELPIGSLISELTNCTFATWVDFSNEGGGWQRIFDFGSGTGVNMFLTPRTGTEGPMRFAITIRGNAAGAEDQTTSPVTLPSGWHHVAVSMNPDNTTHSLYIDGQIVAENTSARYTPSDLGETRQNWLGRSQYSADGYFDGALDDFRIYDKALTKSEIQAVMGISIESPVAHLKLDETSGNIAYDSSGIGYDGTLYGNPQWQPNAGQIDGALLFDGDNDYVELPIGSLISELTNCTFATWVDFSNTGGSWQRIFDFGSGTEVNMFLTPRTGTDGPMRFAITIGGNANEDQTTTPTTMPSGWHHVAVTMNPHTNTHSLYIDGEIVAENTAARYTPSDLGETRQNWLGRSQYPADGYFSGALDDFRIYDSTLSQIEIEAAMFSPTNEN
jgi:hypothetical protein